MLQVTLEDVYNGKTSKLAVVKNVVCSDCKGIGGKEVCTLTCLQIDYLQDTPLWLSNDLWYVY